MPSLFPLIAFSNACLSAKMVFDNVLLRSSFWEESSGVKPDNDIIKQSPAVPFCSVHGVGRGQDSLVCRSYYKILIKY